MEEHVDILLHRPHPRKEMIRAWCALYDDAKDRINCWITKRAPNEYEEIRIEDTLECSDLWI